MSDPIVEQLVQQLRNLPGVGERSARRMAMHLCQSRRQLQQLNHTLELAAEQINPCQRCRNFCSQPICSLCADGQRNQALLCVVSQPQDILAIENSGAFDGCYFVLHGLLSPLNNIGEDELGLKNLNTRLAAVEELILALPYTVEGQATCLLLIDQASRYQLPVYRLAQGIPSGGEVASMDNLTLIQALTQRQPFGEAF